MFVNRNLPFLRYVVEGGDGGGSGAAPDGAAAEDQPTTPPADGGDGQQGDSAQQGEPKAEESGADALLKRIKSERAAAQHEARTAKQKATEAESRAATAEDQLKVTQGDLARERVARRLGLPPEADLSMFTGSTEDEVMASAEKVLAFAASLAKPAAPAAPKPPTPSLQPGSGKQDGGEPTLVDQIREAEKAGDWAKAGALKAMQVAQLAGKS